MKFLWYIISLLLIIFILINNPKSEGLNSLGVQSQVFNSSKALNILEVLIGTTLILFLGFTIVLSAYYKY